MAHSAPYVPHPDDADLAWAPDGLPAKIVITGEVIQHRTLGSLVEIFERLVIIDTLNRNGWHRQAAAKTLGISRVTLFNKMRTYGLMVSNEPVEGEVTP